MKTLCVKPSNAFSFVDLNLTYFFFFNLSFVPLSSSCHIVFDSCFSNFVGAFVPWVGPYWPFLLTQLKVTHRSLFAITFSFISFIEFFVLLLH